MLPTHQHAHICLCTDLAFRRVRDLASRQITSRPMFDESTTAPNRVLRGDRQKCLHYAQKVVLTLMNFNCCYDLSILTSSFRAGSGAKDGKYKCHGFVSASDADAIELCKLLSRVTNEAFARLRHVTRLLEAKKRAAQKKPGVAARKVTADFDQPW